MCTLTGQMDNGYGIVVYEGAAADVVLQRRRPTPGYCIAIWKHGHQSELADLDPEQLAGYWHDNVKVAQALRDVYKPAKVNYQVLGNTEPHVHTHIILRFLDDPAPGRPLPMDDSYYEVVDEEAFRAEVEAVRRALTGG
jgi:diadenosine tetraphosphate (Ap4A) HIT family hydrolase